MLVCIILRFLNYFWPLNAVFYKITRCVQHPTLDFSNIDTITENMILKPNQGHYAWRQYRRVCVQVPSFQKRPW